MHRHLVELPLRYILERGLQWPEISQLPEVPIPTWLPTRLPVDFHKSESAYTITTDIPGVSRSEMKLYKEGDELVISGGRDIPEHKDGNFLYQERKHGSFLRKITLPTDSGNEITATLVDGVLTVTVPRENKSNRLFINVD